MFDVEPLIRDEFTTLDPLPRGAEGDWQDVLNRVQHRPRRRPWIVRRWGAGSAWRPVQIAITAVVALAVGSVTTPLGAAVGHTFEGFSAWITGAPGVPASPEAQRAFEKANARSWASFPPGSELRKLIETTASDSTFTLYGFRSGDALCLRLVATGPAAGANESCAPLQALQSTTDPAFVVASDAPFGLVQVPAGSQDYRPELAAATFGIASDGVKEVILQGDDGAHEAIVAANAFLYVDEKPAVGVRIRSAEAVAANGSTATLPLSAAPYGANGTAAPDHIALPQGPTRVDREVGTGTVSWIEHEQDRGQPIAPDMLRRIGDGALTDVTFAREVQPDPANPARVAFLIGKAARDPFHRFRPNQQELCVFLVVGGPGGSGSCSGLPLKLTSEPFSLDSFLFGSGDQYDYFSGIASDDVAQLRIFLTNGTIEDVPLRDNAYAVPVPRALFPVRVVAYDSASRIIGLDTIGEPNTAPPLPVEGASWATLEHAVAADGTSATISTTQARGGGICWRINFSDGIEGNPICSPPYWEGPPVNLAVQDTPGGSIIYGRVSPQVATVIIRYRDGSKRITAPNQGLVLVAAPQSVKPPANPVAEIIGLNDNGAQIGSEDYSHTPAATPPAPPAPRKP
jgi:hypothetical protein